MTVAFHIIYVQFWSDALSIGKCPRTEEAVFLVATEQRNQKGVGEGEEISAGELWFQY